MFLKNDRSVSRWAFSENAIPVGQSENRLLRSEESLATAGIHRVQEELFLIMEEETECQNLCRSPPSLTKDESLLRLFKLLSQGAECESLNYNFGR